MVNLKMLLPGQKNNAQAQNRTCTAWARENKWFTTMEQGQEGTCHRRSQKSKMQRGTCWINLQGLQALSGARPDNQGKHNKISA
jgi:hypothetical protein